MLTGLLSLNGAHRVFFSPKGDGTSGGGTGKTPSNTPPDKSGGKEDDAGEGDDDDDDEDDSDPDGKGGSKKKEGEEDEDAELTPEELAALPKKVRDAIAKAAADAGKKTREQTEAEIAEKQKADARKDRLAKATADKDFKAERDIALEERDEWKTKYETLVATTSKTTDEAVRVTVAKKHNLPDGYHDMLGNDPEKYVANAIRLKKDLKAGSGDGKGKERLNLEGGNQGGKTSKERQTKAAQEVVNSRYVW